MTVLERLRDFYSQQKSVVPQAMSGVPLKPYVMQRSSKDEAEMTLYGDIVETKPRDWMDEEVEGNYIVMSEVLKDIKGLKDVKNLTIHIHSFGGSSAASTVIYNKLRDLGAHITCSRRSCNVRWLRYFMRCRYSPCTFIQYCDDT